MLPMSVWKHLWNAMQNKGNNTLSLQIWTQTEKCKRKFCIAALISRVVIIALRYDTVMSRMWGVPQLLLLTPSFTFYCCSMQVFCIPCSPVSNESAIYSSCNCNPYFGSMQTLFLFSSLLGHVIFLNASRLNLLFTVGHGWKSQVQVLFHRCSFVFSCALWFLRPSCHSMSSWRGGHFGSRGFGPSGLSLPSQNLYAGCGHERLLFCFCKVLLSFVFYSFHF